MAGVPTITTSSVMHGSVTVFAALPCSPFSGNIATETNVPASKM
ncbi:MAG: hypothetical protein R2879_00770 [Saprospiraceae bacterium]